ncbi:aspartate aminotransferase family protein [Azorhizobium oxalatiphilum]|uniref:Aspartate aminotransferase family protein n=1 Tax=Azorhizobium oxalatiphilum TaxID=980631 RepID=A0A917C2F0_9HYPH|nr:aspartate aminotransferase family protein [Azorhizobium oxalatiphilum]GGF68680.1 aspartate aminotransferase family protein [Azorhizobium oxalatiphilum]
MTKSSDGAPINIGMVNGFNPNDLGRLSPQMQDAIRRRQALLGPAYRLMYANPVEIQRASGVHMYDAAGNEYLDAYNNVASVGHCHPRVVADVHRQMQTLCTHTRYVQDGILDFAADILPTFGAPIEHIMFTCSGSEANDLAVRIAKHHTGKNGVIITSEAYHGNSELTSGFSPSLGRGSRLGVFVRRISAPDSYRMDPAEIGRQLAAEVAREIAELERRGDGIAAFIADSLFSSDGIYSHPVDVLGPVAEVVRAAGGLFIADEVQAGFGRSGDRLWGYQRHGIAPDMVTMGKPMGNGYPVAAVAMAPHAIRSFGADTRYFNTYGGNSVAIAAAQSVFNVIRDEKLMENAARIGAKIKDGLKALAAKDGRIGDVRGTGLYIGAEFVKADGGKTPDSATALAVVDGLRQRRVLISATGYHANTLKIRPPLVFSDADVDRLLTQLEDTLRSV